MSPTALRALGVVAALQALLRVGPVIIQFLGGRGLPTPGTLNEPAVALGVISRSPEVEAVAGFICATGVAQVFIVLALAHQLTPAEPLPRSTPANQLSVPFGLIAASLLMIDGALGITALPQLARLDIHQSAVDGAYLAILGIRNGIDRVIPLTLGIWALITSTVAWRRRRLPRPLTITGLLLGVTGIAGVVLPVAALASLVMAVVWTAGFAGALLRNAARPNSTPPAAHPRRRHPGLPGDRPGTDRSTDRSLGPAG